MDIIRDGKSQIAEDGSLQLVEERDNTFFSGSGQTPPPATEGPTEKEERRRRASSSLLSPMDSALPTLPSSVEELVLTWQASAEVGRARVRAGVRGARAGVRGARAWGWGWNEG